MNLFFGIIPTPPPLRAKSRVYDLKARLDWGKPALTIIDVRDRSAFQLSHLLGAINMPLEELVDRALMSLELTRDIYVYSDMDEEAAAAAAALRNAGYFNVAELQGGLPAWKAVGYPIESGMFWLGA
ncbi:rhodanese-like domain-containing protein [Leptolyngbya ohadii]|uniref:rhodanese-like domain-containing protein n=1 Tax=Leptolyngbya ohadii TaxID=1962290 RepID=UPI000B5989A3|nr:rhodanese-like domain-containing protein [Leptolyngbya ohadii]